MRSKFRVSICTFRMVCLITKYPSFRQRYNSIKRLLGIARQLKLEIKHLTILVSLQKIS